MADILYTYHDSVYVNLTNKCDCACTFCIRSHHDTVGESGNLWHEKDPELSDVIAAMDAFDLQDIRSWFTAATANPPALWTF